MSAICQGRRQKRQPTRKRRRCPARSSSGRPRKVKANLTCLKTMKWCSNMKNRRATATENQSRKAGANAGCKTGGTALLSPDRRREPGERAFPGDAARARREQAKPPRSRPRWSARPGERQAVRRATHWRGRRAGESVGRERGGGFRLVLLATSAPRVLAVATSRF
jgi:hypothetical protein